MQPLAKNSIFHDFVFQPSEACGHAIRLSLMGSTFNRDNGVPSASIRAPPGWYADTIGMRIVGNVSIVTRMVCGWYADTI